eukprot:753037-Hanusia_phi.AAC.2
MEGSVPREEIKVCTGTPLHITVSHDNVNPRRNFVPYSSQRKSTWEIEPPVAELGLKQDKKNKTTAHALTCQGEPQIRNPGSRNE